MNEFKRGNAVDSEGTYLLFTMSGYSASTMQKIQMMFIVKDDGRPSFSPIDAMFRCSQSTLADLIRKHGDPEVDALIERATVRAVLGV